MRSKLKAQSEIILSRILAYFPYRKPEFSLPRICPISSGFVEILPPPLLPNDLALGFQLYDLPVLCDSANVLLHGGLRGHAVEQFHLHTLSFDRERVKIKFLKK